MTSTSLLAESDPVAGRPWAMRMEWCDLAFLHWSCEPERVAALLPAGVELDTFDGRAWLGVVPFRMQGVRFRGTPALPGISAFPEINLRTYVTAGGRPGVWFFSLDVTKRSAVWVARRAFHLPYFHASMRCETEGEGVRYEHGRTAGPAPAAAFEARYRPRGPVFEAAPGSLEAFLTDRLRLFSARPDGTVLVGEVRHPAWPLQACEVDLERNEMFAQVGLDAPRGAPHALFARALDVHAWLVKPVARS